MTEQTLRSVSPILLLWRYWKPCHHLVFSYENGMTFTVTNAWILCSSEKGHCEEWTVIEGEMMSVFLMVYIMVLNHWQVPTMVMNFDGTKATRHFFLHFSNHISQPTSMWGNERSFWILWCATFENGRSWVAHLQLGVEKTKCMGYTRETGDVSVQIWT